MTFSRERLLTRSTSAGNVMGGNHGPWRSEKCPRTTRQATRRRVPGAASLPSVSSCRCRPRDRADGRRSRPGAGVGSIGDRDGSRDRCRGSRPRPWTGPGHRSPPPTRLRPALPGHLRIVREERIAGRSSGVKGRFATTAWKPLTPDAPPAGGEAMNDPEVTMHDALPTPSTGLQAHVLAVEAAGTVLRLVAAVPPSVRFLADQARRAACSVPLNLAEGHGRIGRDRMHHYSIAYGSAKEAASALKILASGGFVDRDAATQASALLDRVRAMAWRLTHPRP